MVGQIPKHLSSSFAFLFAAFLMFSRQRMTIRSEHQGCDQWCRNPNCKKLGSIESHAFPHKLQVNTTTSYYCSEQDICMTRHYFLLPDALYLQSLAWKKREPIPSLHISATVTRNPVTPNLSSYVAKPGQRTWVILGPPLALGSRMQLPTVRDLRLLVPLCSSFVARRRAGLNLGNIITAAELLA
jgi:hypothetical protein